MSTPPIYVLTADFDDTRMPAIMSFADRDEANRQAESFLAAFTAVRVVVEPFQPVAA